MIYSALHESYSSLVVPRHIDLQDAELTSGAAGLHNRSRLSGIQDPDRRDQNYHRPPQQDHPDLLSSKRGQSNRDKAHREPRRDQQGKPSVEREQNRPDPTNRTRVQRTRGQPSAEREHSRDQSNSEQEEVQRTAGRGGGLRQHLEQATVCCLVLGLLTY